MAQSVTVVEGVACGWGQVWALFVSGLGGQSFRLSD